MDADPDGDASRGQQGTEVLARDVLHGGQTHTGEGILAARGKMSRAEQTTGAHRLYA